MLIDLDPQGDLSRGLGIKSEQIVDYLTPCADFIQRGDLEQASKFSKMLFEIVRFQHLGLSDTDILFLYYRVSGISC